MGSLPNGCSGPVVIQTMPACLEMTVAAAPTASAEPRPDDRMAYFVRVSPRDPRYLEVVRVLVKGKT